MVTEHAPKGRRGFYGSWPQIGFAGGLLISTVLSRSLRHAVRGRVRELGLARAVRAQRAARRHRPVGPPADRGDAGVRGHALQEEQSRAKLPAAEVDARIIAREILRAIGMRFSENISFYMLIVFALSYGEDELGISHSNAALDRRSMLSAAVSLIVDPALRRAVGPRRPPADLPVRARSARSSIADRLLPAAADGQSGRDHPRLPAGHERRRTTASTACSPPYFSELFSTRVRYSGLSISAQLGGVFAGAFAPLIATALLADTSLT